MNIRRFFLTVSRILLGIAFLFSGFVKAVDPLGTAYKITDYLTAFNLTMFNDLAMIASCTLIIIELVIGFGLLFGILVKQMSWLAAAFMAVMTPLTLYLAIANPVSDCGCFGDAIVLTNWETFGKNVVLCCLVWVVFKCIKAYRPWLVWNASWIALLIPVVAGIGIEAYSYIHLPLIDFRPYKVGNNIRELMTVPEGHPKDVYKVAFIYEKDGVQKEFSLEDCPYDDSTWVFVDQRSELIVKGEEAPIHDFAIVVDDEDITDQVLDYEGYTILIISKKLEEASLSSMYRINALYAYSCKHDILFYGLSASMPGDVDAFRTAGGASFPIGEADETMLKTVIRSNPGMVLLKNGVIVGKWGCIDIPTVDEFAGLIGVED